MPMVPQAAFAMLACARIGAIHSVVFGGYAAKELASRLDDLEPKLIITCSAGLEPNKVIKYPPIIDEALSLSTKLQNKHNYQKLIYQRRGHVHKNLDNTYHDYEKLMTSKTWSISDCEVMKSCDPLFILYTSGTTGSPKGIVRDSGGTMV